MSLSTIVTSDDPQELIRQLSDDISSAPLSPFETEVIVVQSLGMERWVRHEFATRQGCAASLSFPFPAALCHTLARTLQRKASGTSNPQLDSRFERRTLTWRIFALLEDSAVTSHPACVTLRDYLVDADTSKRFGLAKRIATLFDDYLLYRVDVLLTWERGDIATNEPAHIAWESHLWRLLTDDEQPIHLARWFTDTIALLKAATEKPSGLPARISVFGISTLPPLFVTLLTEIARFVPVRYYVNSPDQSMQGNAGGNPLFTAFGDASRELLNILSSNGTAPPVHICASSEPSPETLLGQLQEDVRAGVTRGRGDGGEPAKVVASTDDSLTLHVCHSPLREMEVLRDQLLAAFATDPTLRPHDVLVLVPDVDVYAPFADAVFGEVDPELPSMPHRVADRSFQRTALPARALLQLLQLVTARRTSGEVLNFLRTASVCRAASIHGSEMDRVVQFVEEARIRWGYDGAARKQMFDLPAVEDNSWRSGLDRLLMGYATGSSDELVGGVLPVAGATLGNAELLGSFAAWVERLFESLDSLQKNRTLAEWSSVMPEVFRELILAEGPDEQAAFDEVIAAFAELHELAMDLPADRDVEFAVIRGWLESRLDFEQHQTGFLVGGMMVCAMKPMRAIPFRVIAMVGLDDAAFPRRDRRAAFDLLGIDPRPGDRDTRSDDRQLFLDTLLSARERLILSYVGRSQKDNNRIAPSVVISELLDEIDHAFTTGRVDANGRVIPVRLAITVDHHLQPFSPAYFDGQDARLFSFSAATAQSVTAARVRTEARALMESAGEYDEAIVAGTNTQITLRDLVDCWVNPAAFYCKRTLGLYIPRDEDALQETETMDVDNLQKYGQQQRTLERHLAGDNSTAKALAHAQAMGDLPSGALAAEWHEVLTHELDDFLSAVGRPTFLEPRSINITGNGWTVTGRLDGCVEEGIFQARASKLKSKDKIRAWISHVALSHDMPEARTTVMGTDEKMAFAPISGPEDVMQFLVEGYMRALHSPLPFLAQASHAYWARTIATRAGKSPVQAAHAAYHGSERAPGDVLDEYIKLSWRGRTPWEDCSEQFDMLARSFWNPLDSASKASTATSGGTSE